MTGVQTCVFRSLFFIFFFNFLFLAFFLFSPSFSSFFPQGFVESLNLSAASAVLCAVLESKEALTPDLTEKEKKRVSLTWMSRTVAGSMAVLRQGAGLNVQGNLLYNRIGQYTTRP